MKTYEGRMTIKWFKNDNGDCRPLTIDVENKKALREYLNKVKEDFLTKGEYYQEEIRLPHSITFEVHERK